jgi:hypothetical protein
VQLVAPPLTRIAALGDAPLAPETGPGGPAPHPPGGPHAGAPPHGPPGPPPNAVDGVPPEHALRVAVEADAIAIAEVLGPARVAAGVRQREALSGMLAETAVWDDLVTTLEAAP